MGNKTKTLVSLLALSQAPIGYMYAFSKSEMLQKSGWGQTLMKWSAKAVSLPVAKEIYGAEYKLIQGVQEQFD